MKTIPIHKHFGDMNNKQSLHSLMLLQSGTWCWRPGFSVFGPQAQSLAANMLRSRHVGVQIEGIYSQLFLWDTLDLWMGITFYCEQLVDWNEMSLSEGTLIHLPHWIFFQENVVSYFWAEEGLWIPPVGIWAWRVIRMTRTWFMQVSRWETTFGEAMQFSHDFY